MKIETFDIGGDLRARTLKAYAALNAEYPYSTDYILATVEYKEGVFAHYPEYSGDVTGRWILAMTMMEKHFGHNPRLHEIVRRTIEHQRPTGFFGRADQPLSKTNRAQIYGNGWLLQGLLAYYEHTGDKKVLESAIRLGEYYLATTEYWITEVEQQRLATYGHAYGCYTHGLDGMVTLYRITGEERFLDLCRRMANAADSFEKSVHSHMHLSTLRGICALYDACGEQKYLNLVKEETAKVVASEMLQSGGVYECYGIHYLDEACSTVDFFYVNYRLWKITGDISYLHRAELVFHNHILYSQLDNGLFGSQPVNPEFLECTGETAYWCCAMFGATVLAEFPELAVTAADECINIDHLLDSVYNIKCNDKNISLKISTRFPLENTVCLTVDSEVESPVKIKLAKPFNVKDVRIVDTSNGNAKTVYENEIIELPTVGKGITEISFELSMPLQASAASEIESSDGKFRILQDANLYYGPLLLTVSKPTLKRRGHFVVLAENGTGVTFYNLQKKSPQYLTFTSFPAGQPVNFLRLTGDPIEENIESTTDIYSTTVAPVFLAGRDKCKVTVDVVLLGKQLIEDFVAGKAK